MRQAGLPHRRVAPSLTASAPPRRFAPVSGSARLMPTVIQNDGLFHATAPRSTRVRDVSAA